MCDVCDYEKSIAPPLTFDPCAVQNWRGDTRRHHDEGGREGERVVLLTSKDLKSLFPDTSSGFTAQTLCLHYIQCVRVQLGSVLAHCSAPQPASTCLEQLPQESPHILTVKVNIKQCSALTQIGALLRKEL